MADSHDGIGFMLWLGSNIHADGLVFYQSRAANVWRRLCGASICVSRCCNALCMVNTNTNDGRLSAGRNYTRSADNGGGVCRFCRWLESSSSNRSINSGHFSSLCCHVFYFFTVVYFYICWRAVY